ncbi:hypothetical protein GGH99_006170, partial [Coemansia sp. RSA 1285]
MTNSGTNSLPESVAKDLGDNVRELLMEEGSSVFSTYIPAYLTEFLEDTATSQRVLETCDGDRRRATLSLARTAEWRQANKVYPVRKHISSAGLAADLQGRVVVHARTHALVGIGAGVGDGWACCSCSCGGKGGNQHESQKRKSKKEQNFGRAIGTLEDVRVALKSVEAEHGVGLCAAVVVPVESVSLGDVCVHDILGIVDIAQTHYAGAVAHVYITATTSVLLEHARLALQPVLRKLPHEYMSRIGFVMADALETQSIGEYVRPTAASVCCTEDDFCSAYSQPAMDSRRGGDSESSRVSRHPSVARLTSLLPTSLAMAVLPHTSKSVEHDNNNEQQPWSPMRQIPRMHALSSSSSASGGGSRHSGDGDAATPIQLASLQRAVQGVQRMLGSLNDAIVGAESRAALAATRSKLAHQADVLMSTVAALNFGVSASDSTGIRLPSYFERRSSSSSSNGLLSSSSSSYSAEDRLPATTADKRLSAAYLGSGHEAADTAGLLRMLALQLVALPVSLLLGKSRASSVPAMILRVVGRAIRALRAMPTMHSLLLLAYKHFRVYAMIIWTGALLVWKANAAMIG